MTSPYIPNTKSDVRTILKTIGLSDVSDLFAHIPDDIRLDRGLDVAGPMSEFDLCCSANDLSRKNKDLQNYTCFLGAGIYDHYIPATVGAITARSEFYTSYTPYQPELSQGNLQVTFEFQTMICQLTGMDVANASMYDGASALAEAALMANNITGRDKWLVSRSVHPAYRRTMETYAWASGSILNEIPLSGIETDPDGVSSLMGDDVSCIVIQYPNFFGFVEEVNLVEQIAHRHGVMLVVCVDPISLGLLKPPGEFNADICVAEGQSLGIPPGYGGPLLGLMSCKKEYVRQMPGRLVGATTDADGRRAYTLTLQTREQHIRRERATSNICTNQALNALAATVYLATLGPDGLRRTAQLCFEKSHYAARLASKVKGFSVPFEPKFVKEFVLRTDQPICSLNEQLLESGIIGGFDLGSVYSELAGHMLVCVTEKRTREQIDYFAERLST